MNRFVFVDPQKLKDVEVFRVTSTDPALIDAVQRALNTLPSQLREIIIQKIYLGMSIGQIARLRGVQERQILSDYGEAKRKLRFHLAGFVRERWGINADGICRLCGHPNAALIEKMLQKKRPSESWGSFCKRLSKSLDEKIGPPKVLIAHIKHLNYQNNEAGNG
jgi:hypothetical protein